jgi:diguanylate cyclase (GGDEF)-like protein
MGGWSIKARFIVLATGIGVVVALLLTGIGAVTIASELRRNLDQAGEIAALRLESHLGSGARAGADRDLRSLLRSYLSNADSRLGLVVFGGDREVLAALPAELTAVPILQTWPSGGGAYALSLEADGIPAHALFREFRSNAAEVAGAWIVVDRRPVLAKIERVRLYAAAAATLALALSLVLAASVAAPIFKPLHDLESTMTGLARGELELRHPDRGPPEVRRLALQLNRLAEQLEGAQIGVAQRAAEEEDRASGQARYLQQTNRALMDIANRDPLTGLANRRRLELELDRHLDLARQAGQGLAVIMMDLDNFKSFNDSAGHLAGDDLLRTVASALRDRTRITDLVVRWGGDEFCILIPHTTPDRALALAGSLVEAIREATRSIPLPSSLDSPGASAGVACFPEDGQTGTELIAKADAALYQVKQSGRGRVLRSASG